MKVLPLVLGALLVTASADRATADILQTGNDGTATVWEVRDAQQRLQALGFYTGYVDGVWGPETRAAYARYQQSRAAAVADRADPPRSGVRPPLPRPVTLSDPTDVRTVQNRLRQLNLYEGDADGVWNPGTQAALESFQRSRGMPVGQIDTGTLSAMGLDPAAFPARTAAADAAIREPLEPGVIRGVQRRLRLHGFYGGRIDGIWGAGTERSLAQFQRSRGIEPTGHLTPATATALGLDPNNLSLSAVPPR